MSNNHEGAPSGATENTGENNQKTPESINKEIIEFYNTLESYAEEFENDLDELEDVNERINDLEAELEAHKEPDQPDGNNAEFLSPAVIKEPDVTDLTIYEARKKKIEALKEKAHKNKALGKVLLIAGIGALSLCLFFGFNGKNHRNESYGTKTRTESIVDDDRERPDLDNLDSSGEQAERLGIYDGYGEKGMYLSENKTGELNFAAAQEVAEVCDNDEVEMTKYTAHNQVESFADYLANLPEELQPEGFKGLSILETEAKLESMSDEDYSAIEKEFGNIMDKAFTRRVSAEGEYQNAYMKWKNPDRDKIHENMDIVDCTTTENGITVNQFYWLDDEGNEIGSMTIKIIYDENGDIVGGCMQVINRKGEKPHLYEGMESVPDPTPTPSPKPTETPAPKDAENLERIDEQILEDTAKDIGTEQVTVLPAEEVTYETITSEPSTDIYQGTSPTIVENQAAATAEPVQEQSVSDENTYNVNLGGANANEYAPVQANPGAQKAAGEAEIPVSEAPGVNDIGSETLDDILAELGIER